MADKEITRRSFIAAGTITGIATIFSTEKLFSAVGHTNSSDKKNTGFITNGQTWVKIDNIIYGARPDNKGITGGGEGYTAAVSGGDYTVNNLEGLIEALSLAKSGETVFIPSEMTIDLTTAIYIDKLVLEIPEGVTLAGNRGLNGSAGALITSDVLKTPVMIKAMGPNVRISGLRIQGPNSKRYLEHHKRSFGPEGKGREYYYKFPVSGGIWTNHANLEVDNCEISAFSRSAISLTSGQDHHIHHNFIHKCQYNGLGYGISHNIASSIIEHNLFDENRHSIAGTGASGCSYIARHNVELGISLSHCFDMHGGRDRKDGTDIAGTSIEIYNNTFRAPQRAVVIRGVPENKCEIYNNWFVEHQELENAVKGLSEKTIAFDNLFGKNKVVK